MSEVRKKGEVLSVNISGTKGTAKKAVPEVKVIPQGFEGDAHAGNWNRQVSMLPEESIKALAEKKGKNFHPGSFGENITTRGIDFMGIAPLDRFIVGEAELEVSHTGSKYLPPDVPAAESAVKTLICRDGLYLRVIKPGIIKPGSPIHFFSRIFRFKVITLSDSASAGMVEDESGPEIKRILGDYFANRKKKVNIEYTLIPDDAQALKIELECFTNTTYDAIFTTGGTGIGPKDITPDVVLPLCDKMIPGIMERIRQKYAENNPRALISRSVAGVMRNTLVFALPGTVSAVREYMEEIQKNLAHLIYMVQGLGEG